MGTKVIDNPDQHGDTSYFVDGEPAGRGGLRPPKRIGSRSCTSASMPAARRPRPRHTRFADAVLADARRRGLGRASLLPFARKVIAEHQDAYLDLVPVEVRGTFARCPATAMSDRRQHDPFARRRSARRFGATCAVRAGHSITFFPVPLRLRVHAVPLVATLRGKSSRRPGEASARPIFRGGPLRGALRRCAGRARERIGDVRARSDEQALPRPG